ncbi:MAG: hypothetical protein ACLFUL_07575 [Desulfobacteraceae bacterium]
MPFQPFPIYDYKSGLVLAKEPWLIPKDALQSLENAYVDRGVMKKRKGYDVWDRFIYHEADESLGSTVNEQLNYSGTLDETPLRDQGIIGDLVISTEGDGETFEDQGDGTLSGDDGGSGTINYATGEWEITYGSNPGEGNAITADYNWHPDTRIMGIFSFHRQDGSSELLFFDPARANKYNEPQNRLEAIEHEDEGYGDIWTGDNSDFFWSENWQDRLFITNGKDQLQVYDGSEFSDFPIDYTGGGSNRVDACLMIFAHKGRLIILSTTEDGTSHPQRARWSAAGTYDDWDESEGGGYVDADTLDRIVTADYIADELIVYFERSVWTLKYTGDSFLPFVWEKLSGTEGAYATHSIVPFSDELLALGPVRFIGTDGLNTYTVDDKIPEYALTIDQGKLKYTYGAVLEEERQAWWLYPPPGADISERALVLQYEDNSWATFTMELSCLGYWEEITTFTWESINKTWEEINLTWNDLNQYAAGYPLTLGGGDEGYIFTLNRGNTDYGDPIPMKIHYGEWNPFVEKGLKARLGWVDLLVTQNPDTSVTIEFYLDHESEPYLTKTIVFEGQAGSEKIWIRVFANAVGNSHSLRIHHTASNPVEIHAVVPYFRPAGPIG